MSGMWMILYYKCNMPDMQVRILVFIGDASGGISDEKNKIFFVPYLTLADCQKALVRRTLDAKRLYRRTGTSLQMHEQSVRTIQRMMGEMRGMGVYCKTGGQPTRQTLKQNEQRQQKVQSEVRKWRQK